MVLEDYLTSAELAALAGTSNSRIRHLLRLGAFPGAVLRGHTWLIPRAEAVNWARFGWKRRRRGKKYVQLALDSVVSAETWNASEPVPPGPLEVVAYAGEGEPVSMSVGGEGEFIDELAEPVSNAFEVDEPVAVES